MVDVIRYAEKFESTDAATTQTFPDSNVVYTPRQDYRGAWAPAVGADYAHLFSGTGMLPKEVGFEDITGVIWGTSGSNADTQFDALASKCRSIGLGKLFVIDQAGVRRWCYAISLGRPGYRTDENSLYNIPYSLRFARFSDWFDEASTSLIVDPCGAYEAFTLTNPGNAPVKTGLTLNLIANADYGFENVIITNVTTGEQMRWRGRAGPANYSSLLIDTSDLSVQFNPGLGLEIGGSDRYVGQAGIGGSDSLDAYAAVTLGNTQGAFFTLVPGDNNFVIQSEGSPNFALFAEFYGAWE